jgi:hypothetical protein
MVKAIIDISDNANRLINIVKAKYGLLNKSRAIEVLASEYEAVVLEPALRPEYSKKLKAIAKTKPLLVGSAEDFRRKYKG